jgi:hypothetical protein
MSGSPGAVHWSIPFKWSSGGLPCRFSHGGVPYFSHVGILGGPGGCPLVATPGASTKSPTAVSWWGPWTRLL